LLIGGLDYHLAFGRALDSALPSINGCHRWVQIDAGSEALFDEHPRQIFGEGIVGDGREHYDGCWHTTWFSAIMLLVGYE
jgi:hypothetical protein